MAPCSVQILEDALNGQICQVALFFSKKWIQISKNKIKMDSYFFLYKKEKILKLWYRVCPVNARMWLVSFPVPVRLGWQLISSARHATPSRGPFFFQGRRNTRGWVALAPAACLTACSRAYPHRASCRRRTCTNSLCTLAWMVWHRCFSVFLYASPGLII